MTRIAFKMQLHPGQSEEYKRRHDAIWPELQGLLRQAGVSDYSIFWDPDTDVLFAILRCEDPENLERLGESEVMQRWWAHMADIMATAPDNVPLSSPLVPMFYLP